jgi:thiol-disulfide isomerase/thioredoxin
MKRIEIILFMLLAVGSCKKQDAILVSGIIVNSVDNEILIYDMFLMKSDTIPVNSDGTFSKSVLVSDEHLGLFKHGNFYIPVNLKPGSTINVDFNTDDVKNGDWTNVAFSGKGSETSAFLAHITPLLQSAVDDSCYDFEPDIFKVFAENSFIAIEDKLDDFQANNPKETLFVEKMKFNILAAKTNCFFQYIRYNTNKNDTSEWINSFRQIVDNLPKDNVVYSKEISQYRAFLISYFEADIKKTLQKEQVNRFTKKYMNINIDEIITLNAPEPIKEAIGNKLLMPYSFYSDSIKIIVKNRYKELVKNPQYLADFENTVYVLEKLKPGNIPPDFNLTDINGKSISLNALKGNVVYMDFWHSRCGPCVSELPFTNELEEKLAGKPIIFLNISIDDTKSDWEKFVKEKQLGGIHIYAPNGKNSAIMKEYAIKGTPTYLIIDKEGKIVEYNSSRPSDSKTEKKLLELAIK